MLGVRSGFEIACDRVASLIVCVCNKHGCVIKCISHSNEADPYVSSFLFYMEIRKNTGSTPFAASIIMAGFYIYLKNTIIFTYNCAQLMDPFFFLIPLN